MKRFNEVYNLSNDIVPSTWMGTKTFDTSSFHPAIYDGYVSSFSYAHGKLAADMGYDVFLIKRSAGVRMGSVGEFPLDVFGKRCTYYRWMSGQMPRGLVVYNDDAKAVAYARKKYETKSDIL